MNRFVASLVLIAFSANLVVTAAWSIPSSNNSNNNMFLQKAATASLVSAALLTAPLVAQAVDFTGSYADPFHPNCLRQVEVVGTKAAVSGTDGNPGCPVDGSGKVWNLVGLVQDDKIFVDFSPKGGPKDLQGKWEAEPVPGIRWPDGNLWSSKVSPK